VGTEGFVVGDTVSIAIGQSPLDRLMFVELAHHIVEGGIVGELVDQLVGNLLAVGIGHGVSSSGIESHLVTQQVVSPAREFVNRRSVTSGLDNVEKLALAFGLTISELFRREASMPGGPP